MAREYLGITINTNNSRLLSEQALALLKSYYLRDSDKTPQEAFARAAVGYLKPNQKGLAQRIYDAASKQWFMYSSPVLSNAPEPGEKSKALPISCFLTYVGDSLESLIEHNSEVAWLSVKGGGVGGHWGDVRAISDKAPGPLPFLKVVDSQMMAYRQGKTRKGSYAAYMDISHPDILEFINIRLPTGGDTDRKCLGLHNAVNVTDAFMYAVEADLNWQLVDPDTGKMVDSMPARELWEKLLETRYRIGEPYLNFIDTAKAALPKPMKDLGLEIHGSNLCNEIHLPTSEDRTAVCCLSSLNLEKYDEWKDTSLVADAIEFLDSVLQYFIDNAPDDLSKAKFSAERERSLGLGAFGFHSYLQKHNIPFESAQAIGVNKRLFEDIKSKALISTMKLATNSGEYLDGIGSGVRNSHLLAIAPNANSSIIAGSSPSIEPWKSNCFTHRTRAGAHLVKNTNLHKVLTEYMLDLGKDNAWLEDQWQSILEMEGSVQHLTFMSDWHKDVFKTAFEIDQHWVIQHAADRQKFICQGQSVNLFFRAKENKGYVNSVHYLAWKRGCKGLYYLRTESGAAVEAVSTKVERQALSSSIEVDDCMGCQG